jgi:hypothetical protein
VKQVSIVLKYDHVNAMLASSRPKMIVEEQPLQPQPSVNQEAEFVWEDPVYKSDDEAQEQTVDNHQDKFVTSEIV